MIYAKCIRGSQIAKNKDDLEKMKEISNNTVYCEGEEAEPKNPYASLDCVPLNCIFQCLKYGNYIAIIENEEFDYTKDYDGNAIAISAKISLYTSFCSNQFTSLNSSVTSSTLISNLLAR